MNAKLENEISIHNMNLLLEKHFKKRERNKRQWELVEGDKRLIVLQQEEMITEIFTNIIYRPQPGVLGKWLKKPAFIRTLWEIFQDILFCGTGWIYIYYNENGSICHTRLNPAEIIPIWKDTGKTELQMIIRCIDAIDHKGAACNNKVLEIYHKTGISYCDYIENKVSGVFGYKPYIEVSVDSKTKGYHWYRLPIICFKGNQTMQPWREVDADTLKSCTLIHKEMFKWEMLSALEELAWFIETDCANR